MNCTYSVSEYALQKYALITSLTVQYGSLFTTRDKRSKTEQIVLTDTFSPISNKPHARRNMAKQGANLFAHIDNPKYSSSSSSMSS